MALPALARLNNTLRIAAVGAPGYGYTRGVLSGIMRASLSRQDVEFLHFEQLEGLLTALPFCHLDGLILCQTAPELDNLGIPIVFATTDGAADKPCVGVDDHAVGALAAEHFRQRGFRHLAFISMPEMIFPKRRWQGFSQAAKSFGASCAITRLGGFWPRFRRLSWSAMDDEVIPWLASLPRPLGLLASNDGIAVQVLRICQQLNIRVPEEIAVLGVDNDELACLMARPPLSTIQLPTPQIGAEALAMICDRVANPHLPAKRLLLPPVQVIVRQSSESTAVVDPDVVAAIRYMRAHVGEPIGVEDLLSQVALSRRELERRFMRLLGRTPLQEILRLRLELAQHYLRTTTMKVPDVARRCGFVDISNFSRAFRSHTGHAPAAYRHAFGYRES